MLSQAKHLIDSSDALSDILIITVNDLKGISQKLLNRFCKGLIVFFCSGMEGIFKI